MYSTCGILPVILAWAWTRVWPNELERQTIVETLAKTEANREKAARILAIAERTLHRKIKEYGL